MTQMASETVAEDVAPANLWLSLSRRGLRSRRRYLRQVVTIASKAKHCVPLELGCVAAQVRPESSPAVPKVKLSVARRHREQTRVIIILRAREHYTHGAGSFFFGRVVRHEM